jgi:pyruvate dehydrogenase E2 component (dihydrolipoamide acetyltransferase)
MQSVIVRRMVESKSQIPHFYVTMAIDMTAALRFRTESNAYLGKEAGISVNDLFIKAAGLALRKFPDINASYTDKGIERHAEINVGNAVAIPRGLVVPVIRNADQKTLPQIAAESRALAEKARTGGLALADYEGGTFSISNLGMLGVEEFSAIVNPPQVAILAVGAAAQEPVVRDDQIVPGFRCRVTLSADHRVVYGWDAGQFLQELKNLLEKPFSLVY